MFLVISRAGHYIYEKEHECSQRAYKDYQDELKDPNNDYVILTRIITKSSPTTIEGEYTHG